MFAKIRNKAYKSNLFKSVATVLLFFIAVIFAFGISANNKILTVYADGEYSITSAETENGEFIVSPYENLSGGENISVDATPDLGYEVDEMYYVDSASNRVDIENDSFEMPEDNITVYVTFKVETFIVTVTGEILVLLGEDILISGQSVTYGEVITVMYIEREGYFQLLTINGDEITNENPEDPIEIEVTEDLEIIYVEKILINITVGVMTAYKEYTGSEISFTSDDFELPEGVVITSISENSNIIRGTYDLSVTLEAEEGYIFYDGTDMFESINLDASVTITVCTVTLTFEQETYTQIVGEVTAAVAIPDKTGDFTISYVYEGRDDTIYAPSSTMPTTLGLYRVTSTVVDLDGNYVGMTVTTFDIKDAATVEFDLETYSFESDSVTEPTVTTNPDDLPVIFFYEGRADTVYARSTTIPTKVGTYYVSAYITDVNYYGTATTTFDITEADLDYTASSYSGYYDGAVHGIFVICYTPGATISYSLDNFETTETSNPVFTSPAETGAGITVYYKIEKEGFTSVLSSETVVITARPIVIKPQNLIIDYGDAVPEFSIENISFGEGDSIEAVFTGELVLGCLYVQGANAGEYIITASGYSYSGSNYVLSYETGTLTVEKLILTITADNFSIEYNSDLPDFTVTYEGFIDGDDESDLLGTLEFDCSYSKGYNPGTYSITPFGLTSENYQISFEGGDLEVTKKTISPVFDEEEYSQVYGSVSGATASTTPEDLYLTYFYEGVENSGAVYEGAGAPTNAGTYTVTVTISGEINYQGSAEKAFIITQKTLIVTANDEVISYLSGVPSYTVSYDGFIGSDNVEDLDGTLTFDCEYIMGTGVGTYDITPAGLTGYNYDIDFADGTLTVGKATPTVVSFPSLSEATYSPTLKLSNISFSGGTMSVNGTTIPGQFSWETPDQSISVAESGNSYSVIFTPTDTENCDSISFSRAITVNKATPVVTTPPTAGAVYYTPSLTLAGVELNNGEASVLGVFSWADSSITLNATTGTSYTVIFTPTDTGNYNTVGNISVTVVVDRARLTITSPTAETKIYSPNMELADITIVGGAAYYGGVEQNGTFEWENPNTSVSVADSGTTFLIRFTPLDSNYEDYDGVYVEITINKAAGTVTFGQLSYSQVYGNVLPASVTTTPEGLNVVYTYVGTGSTVYESSSVMPINAGTYQVTATIDETNYQGSSSTTFAITKKNLTVTADNISINYLGAIPTYTAQYLGFENGDDESDLSGDLVFSCAYEQGDNAGQYTISLIGLTSDNYDIDFVNGTLTVNRLVGSVTFPTASTITYGQTLADSILLEGSSSTGGAFEWQNPADVPLIATAASTGYNVIFTPVNETNYDYSSLSGYSEGVIIRRVTFTVNKATPTLVTVPTTEAQTYFFGITLGSFALSGGSASVLGTFEWVSPTTSLGYTAGTDYAVRFRPNDTTNYNIVEEITTVIVVVNKATPTLNSPPTTSAVSYTPTLTLAGTGLTGGSASVTGNFDWTVPGTSISVLNSNEMFEVTFTPNSPNYTTITVMVRITVNKAVADIAFGESAYSQTYGRVSGATASTTPEGLNVVYAYVGTGSTVYESSTVPVNVGTYNVTATIDDVNYQGSSSTSFTITKKNLTVTADNISINYLAAIPTYTAQYLGFENDDDESDLSGDLVFSCAYEQGDNAGQYTISLIGLTSDNYDIDFVNGTLTVKKLIIDTTDIEIASSKRYTGEAIVFTLDDVFRNVPNHSSLIAISANSNVDAGVYYANITLQAEENYEFDDGETTRIMQAMLYITSADAVVIFPTASQLTYGQTLADCILSGDTVSGGGSFSWQSPATMPTVAQSGNGFILILTPDNILDYDFTEIEGYDELTGTIIREIIVIVNAKTLESTMIANISQLTYTGFAITPTVSATYNEMILVQGTDYTVQYNNNIDAGNALVTITGMNNFTGQVTKLFVIAPRGVVITVVNKAVVYGNALPASISFISAVTPVGTFTPTINILTLNLSFYYTRNGATVTPKNAGVYTLEMDCGNSNYSITYATVAPTLSIQRKSLVIEWSDLIFFEDGNVHKPTAIVVTGLSNENVGLYVSGGTYLPGKHTATAIISPANSNYALVNPTQQYEIVRREISDSPSSPNITVSSEQGFSSGTIISVTEIISTQTYMDLNLVKKAIANYDIDVILNNSDVILESGNSATVTLYIGNIADEFDLYVSEDGGMVKREYSRDGNYITFSVTEFGEVSLIKVSHPLLYVFIVGVVIVGLSIIGIIIWAVVKKKKRGY